MTMNISDPEARQRVGRRLQNVWLHDVAERLRLRRKSIASSDGIDPREVEPYPMSGDVTIVQQGGSALKTALAAATLLTGGGGAALGLASLAGWLDPPAAVAPAQPATPPQDPVASTQDPPPPVEAALPPPVEYRVTFWTEEGEQIEIEP